MRTPLGRARATLATALVMLALAGVACARWAREPRFGALVPGQRAETFRHALRYQVLGNGARVAVVAVPTTAVVTVDVRYVIGAGDDPPGRSGLAHLAEHVSFLIPTAPAAAAPTVGDALAALVLEHNATTTVDATHYHAVLPASALAAALELEAQRMRAACAGLDDAGFARERDVVLAERAERTTPLSATVSGVLAALYGPGHPYARAIDTREIAGATAAEVCALMHDRYAPGAAIVVVTGAVPADVDALLARTIGAVPARPVHAAHAVAAVHLGGAPSQHPAPIAWPTVLVVLPEPARGQPGAAVARVVRERLAGELAAVTQDRPWAVGAAVFELGGPQAPVLAVALELTAATHVEDARAEVFARLARVVAQLRADVETGRPPRSLTPLEAWDDDAQRGAWIADVVQDGGAAWLARGDLLADEGVAWSDALDGLAAAWTPAHAQVAVLTPTAATASGSLAAVAPRGEHSQVPWRPAVDPAAADRPAPRPPAAVATVERYQLANGLTVELAPDASSPLVDARLVFPIGSGHERGAPPGVATAAALLLRPDRDGFFPPAVVPQLTFATTRGTELTNLVDEASTVFTARGLAVWADWHVWYLSWLLDQGRYNRAALAGMHAAALAEQTRAAARPDDDGERALRARLYGPDHPYARPTMPIAVALAALTAADLERWRREHYVAAGATLIVSGGFAPAAMRAEIAALFGPWSAAPPPLPPSIPLARPPPGPAWLALDAPTALQAELTLGFAVPSDPVRDGAARQVLVAMLEDGLRDIRDGMGASYGVDVAYADAGAGGTLLVRGAVDERQAGPALARVMAWVVALRDGAATQRAGFVRARRRALMVAAAQHRGAVATAAHLVALAARGVGPAHDQALVDALATVTPAQVAALAAADLAAVRMVVQVRARAEIADVAFAALAIVPEHVR